MCLDGLSLGYWHLVETLDQCFSTGVPWGRPRVPPNLKIQPTLEKIFVSTLILSFSTFSIEICVIIPLPLANLERKALKQCMTVIKTLLRTLGVPQTIFV
jgi:hypothetical protein